MGEAREIAGGRGLADADEADVVVPERAGRRDRHHLVGLVIGHYPLVIPGRPEGANPESRKLCRTLICIPGPALTRRPGTTRKKKVSAIVVTPPPRAACAH